MAQLCNSLSFPRYIKYISTTPQTNSTSTSKFPHEKKEKEAERSPPLLPALPSWKPQSETNMKKKVSERKRRTVKNEQTKQRKKPKIVCGSPPLAKQMKWAKIK